MDSKVKSKWREWIAGAVVLLIIAWFIYYTPKKESTDDQGISIQTIEHDSCEWVVSITKHSDGVTRIDALAHKPTCRFCAQRSQEQPPQEPQKIILLNAGQYKLAPVRTVNGDKKYFMIERTLSNISIY